MTTPSSTIERWTQALGKLQLRRAKVMLETGEISPDWVSPSGHSSIQLALSGSAGADNPQKLHRFIQMLLAHGCVVDGTHGAAVSSAIANALAETFEALVAGGGKIPDRFGSGPLLSHAMICGSDPQVALTLLELGACPSTPDLADGSTPLSTAAMFDRNQLLERLIGKGAPVDAQDHQGRTALYWAASSGNSEGVRMLLEAGAQVDLPAHDGSTPLMIAAQRGEREVTLALMEQGADPWRLSINEENALDVAQDGARAAMELWLLERATMEGRVLSRRRV